jgi:hypothetical protein
VTAENIAYAAVLDGRLASAPVTTTGTYNFYDSYVDTSRRNIMNLFDDEEWGSETLAWWTREVYFPHARGY